MFARPVDNEPDAEALEARVRFAMARHAAIPPRGFDSIRRRHELHREIDKWLDLLADLREIDALS